MKHLLFLVMVAFSIPTGVSANTLSETVKAPATADDFTLSSLQIPFVKNVGQANADVAFYADTFGGTLAVKTHGKLELVVPLKRKAGYAVIGEEFVGAKKKTIKSTSPAITKVSYFLGKPENWHAGIPTYNAVSMGGLYEGIDLQLKAYNNNVEKLFYLSPGADPESIRIKVSGVRSVNVTEDGLLELKANDCIVYYSVPMAYQFIDNEKHPVDVAYRVSGNSYGFELGNYDNSRELVIDPLLQSTYFGGSGADVILDVAIAPNGSVFAVGRTSSADIINFNSTLDGTDAFVARLNPSLRNIQGVAYIGGTTSSGGFDEARALAFRNTDGEDFDVYVAGQTFSSDLAGITAESADSTFGTMAGESEGFVSWLNSDLTMLNRSTYFGGDVVAPGETLPDDAIDAIAIAPTNNVFIAGMTRSTNIPGIIPQSTDVASLQDTYGGGPNDGFVARLSTDLTGVNASTYLGGSDEDEVKDLFLGATHAFVSGHTKSTSTSFPGVTAGSSFQDTLAGGFDIFVTKMILELTGSGTDLKSTYLGGDGDDKLQAMADTGIDTLASYIYLAGTTDFTSVPFPLGSDVAAAFSDPNENFIAYMQKDLSVTSAYQGTFLGGEGDQDAVGDIVVLKQGTDFNMATDSVYLTGVTNSSIFPGTEGGDDSTLDTGGFNDAFVMRIDATLSNTATYQSTYLGGEGANEDSNAIAVSPMHDVYVGGTTESVNFSGITSFSADTDNSAGDDSFIARFDSTLDAASTTAEIQVIPTSINFGDVTSGGSSDAVQITIRNVGDPVTADNLVISGFQFLDPINPNFQIELTGTDSACGSATVNFVVKPGDNCVAWVRFTPQTGSFIPATNSAVPFQENLIISSNDLDERNVNVLLIGTGGTDSDGVSDFEEMGPDGTEGQYDGNSDGTPDLEQASVASLHSFDKAFYVTIAVIENGLELENVTATSNPTTANLPANIQAPFGYYSFTIIGLQNGGTATVKFVLNSTGTKPLTGDEDPDAYWKFGKETATAVNETWYEFTYDGVNGAQVNANEITLSYTDGQRGDRNLIPDGQIDDPGAPVKLKTVTVVPAVDGGSSSFCFIATAAYGSNMHDDIKVLRKFRDDYLMTNIIGRIFVSTYYRYSPPIADYVRASETRRMVTRWLLTPLVYSIKHPHLALLLMLVIGLMIYVYRQRVKLKQVA